MNMYIAVLPGDGIGPEITQQALNVMTVVARRFNHQMHASHALIGTEAIERVGTPYPNSTHALCMESDAVLFGAVGDKRYDDDPTLAVRPKQGLLAMRKNLGLYANIRPIALLRAMQHRSPLRKEILESTDFVCVRELTGGLYFGRPQGRSEDGITAYDTCVYSRMEIERVVDLAFRYAMRRRKKVTIVDKANVLATSRLWREVSAQIAKRYPQVTCEFLYVDLAVMRMIQQPTDFDVIVSCNLFGDILADEASALTGAVGMLPSASIGQYTSVFEPTHSAYPQEEGKDLANPISAILSAAMMYDYAFGLKRESRFIRQAVSASLNAMIRTVDIQEQGLDPYKTSEVGRWICDYLAHEALP